MENDNEPTERLNTTIPFQTQFRNDLTLKRRSPGMSRPMESDNTVPFEDGSASSPHGQAGLQAAWDKLYKARAILEAEQVHLRDDRIALQGEIDLLQQREQNVAARELRRSSSSSSTIRCWPRPSRTPRRRRIRSRR